MHHTDAFFTERNYAGRLAAGFSFMPENQDIVREPLQPPITLDPLFNDHGKRKSYRRKSPSQTRMALVHRAAQR